MKKKQTQTKINTLKPIRHNISIENKFSKKLRAFANQINKSCQFWILSKIRKYQNNDLSNISKTLELEFNQLLNFWSEKANDLGYTLTNNINKQIVNYVNSQFVSQGIQINQTIPRTIKQTINSNILQQLSLIKSIPQEIINKYEMVLYNSINSFDLQALEKQFKQIGNISNKRAKMIARDQVGKALENYSSARSKDLGFDYYVWNTSRDERVSKGKGGHIHLDKRIYRYDTPSAIIDSYGNKGHTGQRVNCRCIQTPLILDINQKLKFVRDDLAGDYYVITNKI